MVGLVEQHDAMIRAWTKASFCTYPNCKCPDVHQLVRDIDRMARRVGHSFKVDKARLAATNFCKVRI